jgi:hypothetical protein
MTGLAIFEALCGVVAIYVGARFVLARKIPVVSEGGFEPLAWIEGRAAVLVGCLIVCLGLGLLAASFGFIHLP